MVSLFFSFASNDGRFLFLSFRIMRKYFRNVINTGVETPFIIHDLAKYIPWPESMLTELFQYFS